MLISMVSFSCESCNDTLKKPKLDSHVQRCRWARFTCLDCNTTFEGTTYRAHTSCISEDQKYQKSVYKAPKQKGQNKQQQQHQQQHQLAAIPSPVPAPIPEAIPMDVETPAASPSKKRGRAMPPVPVVVGSESDSVVEPVAESGAGDEQPKKKAKKDKGKKKAVEPAVEEVEPLVEGGDAGEEADEESQAVVEVEVTKKSKKQKQKEVEVEVEAEVEAESEVEAPGAEKSDAADSEGECEQVAAAITNGVGGGENVVDTTNVTNVAIAFVSQVGQHHQQDIIVQPDLELHGGPIPHPLPHSDPNILPSLSPALPVIAPSSALDASGPAPTIHAYLAALLPELLLTSRSLAALRSAVHESAAAAGWSDEAEVERAFLEGVWVGGTKPKKMLVLNFERATQVKNEKRRKQKIKGQ